MPAESKKHHFVPRSILKNFTLTQGGNQVYVYDKSTGRAYVSSLVDAGSENKFNTAELGEASLNFEAIFDDADSRLGEMANRLLETRSLKDFTDDDILVVKHLLIVQFLRTKINRDTIIHIKKRETEIIEGLGYNFTHDIHIPGAEEVKLLAALALFETEKYLPFLDDKLLFLFETDSRTPFIISDNPVTTRNDLPFGGVGLGDSGVEIYFPLSADLCIVFWCNSIMDYIRREKPPLAMRYDRILQTGTPVNIPATEVDDLNKLQLAYSSRFVYSSFDCKAWAGEFLNKYPKYKKVETKITLGEMGEGPPPKSAMPPGEYLVVITRKQNFMLPITLLPDLFSITFMTDDYRQLQMIREDGEILKAEVYRDGKVCRVIPNGMLYEVDLTGQKPNMIGYHDLSIAKLMASVLNKKTD